MKIEYLESVNCFVEYRWNNKANMYQFLYYPSNSNNQPNLDFPKWENEIDNKEFHLAIISNFKDHKKRQKLYKQKTNR